MTSYESRIRGPRVDGKIGLTVGTNYGFKETPSIELDNFGRGDQYMFMNSFGQNALAQSKATSEYLPRAGYAYGEMPDGQLHYFGDGSTATSYGGYPTLPVRSQYDEFTPMSRTLPLVDGVGGMVQNGYNNQRPDYDSPAYDAQIGALSLRNQYRTPVMANGRELWPVGARPDQARMEKALPSAVDVGRYKIIQPVAGRTLNSRERAERMMAQDNNFDVPPQFTPAYQKAPTSAINDSRPQGPGASSWIGAHNRKNYMYNVKKEMIEKYQPF